MLQQYQQPGYMPGFILAIANHRQENKRRGNKRKEDQEINKVEAKNGIIEIP
ncbi:hypothetical protein [Janthinobacterium sp. HLX7-2]|uniref:hypothetical protein n=1 Tax=Janthinobacterium sp. HLX7-2 TaxID=1259331 RepID=UPI003F23EB12